MKGRIQVEKKVLIIFGPKRDEMMGGWRKLHNELHNVCCCCFNWLYSPVPDFRILILWFHNLFPHGRTSDQLVARPIICAYHQIFEDDQIGDEKGGAQCTRGDRKCVQNSGWNT
jgi:hypothetical protein